MKAVQILAVLGGLASVAQAHIEMISPPALKSKANPHAGQDIDYSMTSPLDASGANFPCKGYQSLMGTPAGASVADWTPGEKQTIKLSGSAVHNGGSCQASLSYDKGKTWTVVHSFMGNCPSGPDSSLEFTLPADTPAGEALFAWSWVNNTGNREFYMNCATVTIGGGKSKRADTAFSSRPAMFEANLSSVTECKTTEGADVVYPNPGPDVTDQTDGKAGAGLAQVAACGGSSGGGGGGDSPDPTTAVPEPTTAVADPTTAVPEPTTAPEPPATTSYVSQDDPSSLTSSSPSSSPGGIFITQSDTQVPEPAPTTIPSTMVTVTTPSTPAPPTPTGGDGGSSGSFAAGTACTAEGDWNCVGGSQFQRCASGQWSALISMAAGTSCQAGQSTTLNMVKKRGGSRIYNQPWNV